MVLQKNKDLPHPMDAFLSQYGLLKQLRSLLEPQDYINLLRSQDKDGRHKADLTDIKQCLNPVNYLFRSLDPIVRWRRVYGCSFILCGSDVARLHEYLIGGLQNDDKVYDIALVIAFEDSQSYTRALTDTLNGAVEDVYDEIERAVRRKIVSLSPGTQSLHETVVRLHLSLQLFDLESLSFFAEDSTGSAWIECDPVPAIFVCSHATEPSLCLRQPLLTFPSPTTSVVFLGALDNPSFIAVKKCQECSH